MKTFSKLSEYLTAVSKVKVPPLPKDLVSKKESAYSRLYSDKDFAIRYEKWFNTFRNKIPHGYVKNLKGALIIEDLGLSLVPGQIIDLSALNPVTLKNSQSLKTAFNMGYVKFVTQKEAEAQAEEEENDFYPFPIYSFDDELDVDRATYEQTKTRFIKKLPAECEKMKKKANRRGRYEYKRVVTVGERMGYGGDDGIEMNFLDVETGLPREPVEFGDTGHVGPSHFIDPALISEKKRLLTQEDRKPAKLKYKKLKGRDDESGNSLIVTIE